MKVSARNLIPGKVVSVTKGDVNCEVVVEVAPGVEVVSVITRTSVENLGIEPGVEVRAMVKASSVMLTRE
ncbi:MAG: TOBE domain-containing protein [Desulfovibrio sp.]|jgi:molybdopterin-binding protein|nr:TOBE domain-containing protein [Desulfovibrio sp.]